MQQDKLKEAQDVAGKLADSLKRPEWLTIAAGLDVGRQQFTSKAQFGQWKAQNFAAKSVLAASSHALWMLDNWTDIEPYTTEGQPLADVHHPTDLYAKFKKLTSAPEETPVEGTVPVKPEQVVTPLPAPTDTMVAFLKEFAQQTGLDFDQSQAVIKGLMLDLKQRKESHSLSVGKAKTFDTAYDALAYLAYATQWKNAGGGSLEHKLVKLKGAMPDLMDKLPQAVVAKPDGTFGVNLKALEEQAAAGLSERKDLMAVKNGSVFGMINQYDGGIVQREIFTVDDNAHQRAEHGKLFGSLNYQSLKPPYETGGDGGYLSLQDLAHAELLTVLDLHAEESKAAQKEDFLKQQGMYDPQVAKQVAQRIGLK